MKEVEILVSVLEDKEKVLKALSNFKYNGIKKVLDIYIYHPKTNKFHFENKECLRIRKKDSKNFLTYKKDNFDSMGNWVYSDEYEIEISDFETAIKIMEQLGLKELIKIDNEKHTFVTDMYEIVLEDVKDLGLFLEVERFEVKDEEDIPAIKKDIRKFIDKLGIEVSKELNFGKPELMLQNSVNNFP